ncbi:hypothetical protein T08_2571 [Trichinella sp. T8]|uniref:Uncharacterized protein n=1 Tax=Trichinella murrelli TaxID=144512 RepID=A0A0V0TL41_9BILA|nr:hypothetical protein T05_15340 [Trichinella murrelli]KRZ95708.1 hypothetical protein T08_2571 [Trichinella sp. T8]
MKIKKSNSVIQIQFFTALLALFVVVIFYIRIERHFSFIVPSNSERYHFRRKANFQQSVSQRVDCTGTILDEQ